MFRSHLRSGFVLHLILEDLSLEELVNLIRNSISGVVSEIGTGFIGSRGGGRTLPARDVDSLQVLGQIDDLDGV